MSTALAEAPEKVKLLVETTGTTGQGGRIIAESQADGKVVLKGELAKADTVTANNRMYTRQVLEREIGRLNKDAREKKLFGELDHPCLNSDDFRVLALNGWQRFRDIRVGDRVWSRLNGKAVVSVVEDVVDQPYDGPVFRFKGRAIDSTFTPGHRMLLVNRPGELDQEAYATANEIFGDRCRYGHSAIPKSAEWGSEGPDTVTIPGIKFDPKTQHFRTDVGSDLELAAELFAAFMGLYLSEGSCSTESGENYSVFIHQKTPWSRQYIWQEVLSRFPKELGWREEKDGFYLADARLYQYLKPLGDVYNKRVPDEVKQLGADRLKEFLFWFGIGDGRMVDSVPRSARKEGWDLPDDGWRDSGESCKSAVAEAVRLKTVPYIRRDLFSVSERLVRDLHECLVRSGECGSLSVIEPDADYEFAGRVIKAANKRPLHQLHISTSKNIWMDSRFLQVEPSHHVGNIFCLRVTHGNFYMEQNGKSFWTGNSDGRTQFSRVSHIIEDVRLEPDGRVIGILAVLDTAKGKDLKAIIQAGGAVGVSSRGTGTTHKRDDGVDVVNEDYNLITFDVVADPAHAGSYPEVFFEHREAKDLGRVDMPEERMSLDDLVAKDQKVAEQLAAKVRAASEEAVEKAREAIRTEEREKMKESVEKDVLNQIADLRKETEEEVREEIMSDPKFADAKRRLEAIRSVAGVTEGVAKEEMERIQSSLSERETKIKGLEQQLCACRESGEKMRQVAKRAAKDLYMERTLAGNPAATQIRKLAEQSFNTDDNAETIRKKVEDAKATWENIDGRIKEKGRKIREIAEEIKAEVKKETDALSGRVKELESENAKLKTLTEKSLAVAQEFGVQAAKSRAVEVEAGDHPSRHKIRSMLESANVRSEDEARSFVRKAMQGETAPSSLVESIRSRIAKGTGQTTNKDGTEVMSRLDEERSPKTLYGYDLRQMRKLCGIKEGQA